MIPAPSATLVEDSLGGTEHKFTVDAASARWVMKSLTDLYSDTTLAPIREYSTNAYDQHVKHNIDRPIEVTLPTRLQPTFVARNFGPGMSEEDMVNTFTKYGNSDKRNSNDFNGMLGFGSKSGLTYASSFTVKTIVNGVQTSAIISRDAEDVPVMRVVQKVRSMAEEGTSITIPVSDVERFNDRARRFYSYWPEGRVLVNGVAPARADVFDNPVLGFEDLFDGERGVLMGNVFYPIDSDQYFSLFENQTLAGSFDLTFVVPVGAVEFAPSREALMYTDHTVNYLKGRVEEFESHIIKSATDEIAKAKTHYKAVKALSRWRQKFGSSFTVQYKGEDIPSVLEVSGRYRSMTTKGRIGNNGFRNLRLDDVELLIVECPVEDSSTFRSKVREYLQITNMWDGRWTGYWNGIRVHWTTGSPDTKWIDPKKVIKWEDLKKALPKNPKVKKASTAGLFDIITKDDIKYGVELPDGVDFVYFSSADYSYSTVQDQLATFDSDKVGVMLYSNRWGKFKRENPTAMTVQEFQDDERKKIANTDFSWYAGSLISGGWETLASNSELFDDPDIAGLRGVLDAYNSRTPEQDALRVKFYNLSLNYGKEYHNEVARVSRLMDVISRRYPLLHIRYGVTDVEEHALYMNAKYASLKEAKND